ncbi:MAG: hypothetical protein AAF125_12595 [Chloroflexota bacterium]
MEPVLYTTAEYAMISQDGKLTLGGIFDSIQSSEFPANSPRMFLVAQIRAQPEEFETVFDVRFRLFNEEGEELINLNGAGEVPVSEHNLSVLMNQVVTLNNIQFEKPGTYHFTLEINGEEAAYLPFNVVKMKKPSNQVG